MKNKFVYSFKSKVKLKISGKNINRFITRLNANEIEILRCDYIDSCTINILIYLSDYEKLLKLKTIYDVEWVDTYGAVKIKKKLNMNKYLIISLVLGYFLLMFLSNVIFSVSVIHNDIEVRDLIKEELAGFGLKERTIKKSFNEIERVKEEILNKYKDKLEWLEIETHGTKYVVRVEVRKINDVPSELKARDIVAKKAAIIKEIKAENGVIVKDVNSYVKPGDVVISGSIYLNEELKSNVSAKGVVYGEVWYETNVTYPYVYNERRETNNKKNVLVLKLLNKNIELFNFKPFLHKKVLEDVIIQSNVVPFSLVRQRQTEMFVIEDILTNEQAFSKAVSKGISKVLDGLGDDEHIINYKVLSTNIKDTELELKIFFSVYEDITDYRDILEDVPES